MSSPTQKKTPPKRCPKGTRRNKKGECVAVEGATNVPPLAEGEKPPTKRCPKGTRKNKNGECVPVAEAAEPAVPLVVQSSVSAVSPPKPRLNEDVNKQILDEIIRQTRRLSVSASKSVSPPAPSPLPPPSKTKATKTTKVKTPKMEAVATAEEESPSSSPDNGEITSLNSLLRKKELFEHKTATQTHRYDFLYPELNDPLFNLKIARRKEFNDTKYDGTVYDVEARANAMCDAKFELSPHQLFVKNFLSFQTPYNSLLLYHSLGTGKTCSAIGIAEEMRSFMKQVGIKEKILIVASPNIQGNFRRQLFDEATLKKIVNPNNPEEYSWNIESCVGNSLLNEITPSAEKKLPYEKVVSNINAIINQYYEFMGYGQLANYINSLLKVDTESGYTEKEIRAQEIRNIRAAFNNKLVIIDEVHNIRLGEENRSNAPVASLLMKVAKYATNMRLLLLSATPMFNSYEEIVWLVNLMSLNDKRSTIEIKDVFDVKGEFKRKSGSRAEDGRDLLIRKLTGYVSYVRGENPYLFPFRVYPRDFSPDRTFQTKKYPSIQMNGKAIDTPLKHVNVYTNALREDTFQYKSYSYLMTQMRSREYDVYSRATGELLRKMPSFENMDTFGYTILQLPLEMLNMVYPSAAVEQMLRSRQSGGNDADRELLAMCVGEKGMSATMKYETQNKPNMIKCNYEYAPDTLKKYGRIFSPQELPKYSHKIAHICDTILQSKGIIIVYSQYIDGGVIPMALALEELGFTRFGHASYTKPLFKTPPTEAIDARTMRPRGEMGDDFVPAKYVIISGDKYFSPNNKQEMRHITAPENTDGSVVKVVLITKSGSEGLDFKCVRQVHVMEPWYNMNRIEQIVGRGVRNLSHCMLPFSLRNVQIYLHSTILEGGAEGADEQEEAADLYVYRVAEKKALQIGRITRLLKETAVDCILNIEQSANFTPEKLEAIERNKRVEQELANGRRIVMRLGDQPYTDICDYMDTCEWKCASSGDISPQDIVKTTYNTQFAMTNTTYISNRIKQLYREQTSYHRNQLVAEINAKKVFPLEQIYYTLTDFIENKRSLVDRYLRTGYMVNAGAYYLFQPHEIADERASVFDRSVPVHHRAERLTLEVPKTTPMFETAAATKNVAAEPSIIEQGEKSPQVPQKETEANKEPDLAEVETTPKTNTDAAYIAIIRKLVEQKDITQRENPLKKTKEWEKHFFFVVPHLRAVYGLTTEQIAKYAIHHFVDILPYEDRAVLVKHLYGVHASTAFSYLISPALESEVKHYFEQRIMRNTKQNKMGILMPRDGEIEIWIRSADATSPEWSLGEIHDYNLFMDDLSAKYNVSLSQVNEIVGFVADFKKKEAVFKVKDMKQKRNNNGARVDSAGKADVVKLLNQVVGEERYSSENTEHEFTQVGLSIVLELVMRHYTAQKHKGKIYFLTYEQGLLKNISRA